MCGVENSDSNPRRIKIGWELCAHVCLCSVRIYVEYILCVIPNCYRIFILDYTRQVAGVEVDARGERLVMWWVSHWALLSNPFLYDVRPYGHYVPTLCVYLYICLGIILLKLSGDPALRPVKGFWRLLINSTQTHICRIVSWRESSVNVKRLKS